MTLGSGLYLSPDEKNEKRLNWAVRQLIEGRSNAVGSVTITHDGSATSTKVTAITCGPNTLPVITPVSSQAVAVVASTYVDLAHVAAGSFYISHNATSTSGITFGWLCLG